VVRSKLREPTRVAQPFAQLDLALTPRALLTRRRNLDPAQAGPAAAAVAAPPPASQPESSSCAPRFTTRYDVGQ